MRACAQIAMMTLLLVTLPSVGRAAPGQPGRIGYVEVSRVLQESKAALAARRALETSLREWQGAVEAERAKLDALKRDLEQGEKTLPEAEKQARAKDYLDRSSLFQAMVADVRRRVEEADRASTGKVLERMRTIVTRIGKTRNFELILEKTTGNVLFSREGADLTAEVIKAMDALQ